MSAGRHAAFDPAGFVYFPLLLLFCAAWLCGLGLYAGVVKAVEFDDPHAGVPARVWRWTASAVSFWITVPFVLIWTETPALFGLRRSDWR